MEGPKGPQKGNSTLFVRSKDRAMRVWVTKGSKFPVAAICKRKDRSAENWTRPRDGQPIAKEGVFCLPLAGRVSRT